MLLFNSVHRLSQGMGIAVMGNLQESNISVTSSVRSRLTKWNRKRFKSPWPHQSYILYAPNSPLFFQPASSVDLKLMVRFTITIAPPTPHSTVPIFWIIYFSSCLDKINDGSNLEEGFPGFTYPWQWKQAACDSIGCGRSFQCDLPSSGRSGSIDFIQHPLKPPIHS